MKLLIDMNLTPQWVEFFAARAIESVHWSQVGSPRALDHEIMAFARQAGFVIFTHDLDFGSILAVTHARGPSVIQARVEDPVPAAMGDAVVAAVVDNMSYLERGALVTIDPDKLRIRILPIVPGLRT